MNLSINLSSIIYLSTEKSKREKQKEAEGERGMVEKIRSKRKNQCL
jgi:hypothetical protein